MYILIHYYLFINLLSQGFGEVANIYETIYFKQNKNIDSNWMRVGLCVSGRLIFINIHEGRVFHYYKKNLTHQESKK